MADYTLTVNSVDYSDTGTIASSTTPNVVIPVINSYGSNYTLTVNSDSLTWGTPTPTVTSYTYSFSSMS